jgi:hypothetical protein
MRFVTFIWLGKILIGLMAFFFVTPTAAESLWNHNGSSVELASDGPNRRFTYSSPRRGLPVQAGTTLFRGVAIGSRWQGTAYVFSQVCGARGYQVSGSVDVRSKQITLFGRAPLVDGQCNVVAYRDDVLLFSFNDCSGCTCGEEVELAAIYPPVPDFRGNADPMDAKSCPYLSAYNDNDGRWTEYGKVIRDARGADHEMTETIRLSSLGTRFRLTEKEPEHSFIRHVHLSVVLKSGRRFTFYPVHLASSKKQGFEIPPFRSVELFFRVPHWIKAHMVSKTSFSIRGYYLRAGGVCRRSSSSSGAE